MSPFYIGARRGLWQANIISQPFFIAIAVYRQYYWLVAAAAGLLVTVILTWPWAGRKDR
jgi:hypothetical protein